MTNIYIYSSVFEAGVDGVGERERQTAREREREPHNKLLHR